MVFASSYLAKKMKHQKQRQGRVVPLRLLIHTYTRQDVLFILGFLNLRSVYEHLVYSIDVLQTLGLENRMAIAVELLGHIQDTILLPYVR